MANIRRDAEMSLPALCRNPKLGPVKLKSGRTVVAEKLGEQHYLVWSRGTALTEVQCIPTGSGRWYYRGSGLNWRKSRGEAIQAGLVRNVQGKRLNGRELEAWSAAAQAAMVKLEKFVAAKST